MNSFMSYLKSNYPSYYKDLSKYSIASSGFDSAWKRLAADGKFADAQHQFIKKSHYDPVANKVKSELGIDASKMSIAFQNVLWSLGVQHGSGGAMNVIRSSGIKIPMNEKAMITAIYNERMKVSKYFSRSSKSVQNSVYNRFKRELADALAMLG